MKKKKIITNTYSNKDKINNIEKKFSFSSLGNPIKTNLNFLNNSSHTKNFSNNSVRFSSSYLSELEKSMLELKDYIEIVAPSDSETIETVTNKLTFRPKNLPKKSKEEEEYHRKLVEEKEKEELLEKIKSKDSQITTLNEEIISLKNQLLNYKDSIEESQEKRSKLLNNIKYEKLISNDKESKIVKLEQENKNLLSNNNSLKNQNEYLLQIIEKLKNQIEDKGKEFFYLEKEYDENKEIKIDNHTFKGYINKMSKWLIIDLNKINRNISIFFGKKPLKVSFSINGLDFDVDIDNILKMDYYHENKNKIKFIIDGKGKEDIR